MKLAPGQLNRQRLSECSREQLESLVLALQGEVHYLSEQNLEKDKIIANLKEINLMRTIEKYKPSSEQMNDLFDETELYFAAQPAIEAGGTITVKEHEKTRKKTEISSVPASAPVYDVYHTDGAEESFMDNDGVEYKRIDDEVIEKLAYVPQRVIIEKHHYPRYKAQCKIDGERDTIVKLHNREIDAIAVSPSFISYIAISKYDDHIPLYRLSEILQRDGIRVSRQKMAGWLIKYMDALTAFSRYWDKMVFQMRFLAMDESPITILDVKNKEGQPSNSCFMFFRRGSSYSAEERRTHVLISFKPVFGRSANELLDEYRTMKFEGYVMTDGLAAYNTIENHCSCWVHAVRPFKKLLKANAKNRFFLGICQQAAELFRIDEENRALLLDGELAEEGFLSKRKDESLPVLEKIFTMCKEYRKKFTPKGQVGNAITYIIERERTLMNYLNAVEATPSNNESERCAKAFATGRKNWLFSKCVDGADASAFFYSLIESAKANGIDPSLYLEFICTKGPACSSEEDMERLLPWNADLSGINEARCKRAAASPDPERRQPFMLTGLRR